MMNEKKLQFIENIGWRYETEHNMTRRMQDHDYQSRCIYMLTLALADRSQPLLGHLSLDAQGEAMLTPSALGEAVKREWYALGKEFPQLWIMRVQLMEEHLHVVVFVKEKLPKHLGKLVGIVKNRSNKHYWQQLTTQGRLAPKGQQTPPPLFAENFQDTILTHEGQLETMLKYIEDNPKRAITKRQNPELFKVVRELRVKAMQPLKAMQALKAMQPSCNELDLAMAMQPLKALQPSCNEPNMQPRGNELDQQPRGNELDGAGGLSGVCELGSLTFAAIGNKWLLERGVRMQVRCHNNTTPENLKLIERQKEYFLNRGQKGGVIVSPCISAGEKEIARAALDAKLPLIVILENGFPPLYKPPGKYFDACAEGLLLMLAPWSYHMEKRAITRQQCLALNAMAAAISNEPWTAEIERAMQPLKAMQPSCNELDMQARGNEPDQAMAMQPSCNELDMQPRGSELDMQARGSELDHEKTKKQC